MIDRTRTLTLHKFRHFLSEPTSTKFLVFDAMCHLLISRLLVLILPAQQLFKLIKSDRFEDKKITDQEAELIVRNISNAIRRTKHYLPGRIMCLEKAVAAKLMLNRRNISSQLYFGLTKDAEGHQLKAHAWLKYGSSFVTGAKDASNFAKLYMVN